MRRVDVDRHDGHPGGQPARPVTIFEDLDQGVLDRILGDIRLPRGTADRRHHPGVLGTDEFPDRSLDVDR
jgi:hypothetical protein